MIRRLTQAIETPVEEGPPSQVTFFGSIPKFRGAAQAIQSYSGHEWIIAGPAETGKTVAALWRLDELLRTTPMARATLLRKMQVTVWGTVHETWKRIQALRVSLGAERLIPYGGEKPEWYIYPNGARVWIGGLDNANKILSGERDWIFVNQAEELTQDDWQILSTRCTGRGAVTTTPMLFGDCNPSDENHWILQRPSIRLFHSKHEDNPTLFDDDGVITEQGKRSMATLDALTGTTKQRLRYGRWVGVEGQFFEEWDDDRFDVEHIYPDGFPAHWVRWPAWGALDYGYTHRTAAGLFVRDDQYRIIMLGEHSQNKWLPQLHCRAIRQLAELVKVPLTRVRKIVAGHDCFQQRGDEHAQTIAQQYLNAKDPDTGAKIGLRLEKANNDRVTGSQELVMLLGQQKLGIAPKLYFVKDRCRRTMAGMSRVVGDPLAPESYRKRDADAHGEGGDDEVDMLRYGVMAARVRPSGEPGRAEGLG